MARLAGRQADEGRRRCETVNITKMIITAVSKETNPASSATNNPMTTTRASISDAVSEKTTVSDSEGAWSLMICFYRTCGIGVTNVVRQQALLDRLSQPVCCGAKRYATVDETSADDFHPDRDTGFERLRLASFGELVTCGH
jgi:hypothetical protein